MKPSMVLFSHIHKSGGTTLKWIMRNSFGLRHLEIDPLWPAPAFPESAFYHANGVIDRAKSSLRPIDRADLDRVLKTFPHVVSLQSHNLSPGRDLGNHRWFTYLRDPRKQVASWYQYLVEIGKRTDLSFLDYMKTEFPHERQCKMLSGIRSRIRSPLFRIVNDPAASTSPRTEARGKFCSKTSSVTCGSIARSCKRL